MLGNYRVSKQLGISRVVLSSMELVIYYNYSSPDIPVDVAMGYGLDGWGSIPVMGTKFFFSSQRLD
jgi:hypothetical protein